MVSPPWIFSLDAVLWAIALASGVVLLWVFVRCVVAMICRFVLFREKISYTRTCAVEHEQHFIRNPRGESLDLWWLPNPDSSDAVLYLHGNMGRLPHFFAPLHKHYNVLAPSYPGYGLSEGRPCDMGIYETAELAYQWLLKRGFRDDQITIWGHSLGGAAATYVASLHPSHKKLVIINSFCSVKGVCRDKFGALSLLVRDKFNSTAIAKEVKGKVVVACYKGDKTIPYASCRRLYESFATPEKTLLELPGHTHEYFDVESTLMP